MPVSDFFELCLQVYKTKSLLHITDVQVTSLNLSWGTRYSDSSYCFFSLVPPDSFLKWAILTSSQIFGNLYKITLAPYTYPVSLYQVIPSAFHRW
jgi:hypothetical protein